MDVSLLNVRLPFRKQWWSLMRLVTGQINGKTTIPAMQL
nr:MAG TPA: hypothetical protein [Caudoviricetes sp.]